MVNISGEARLGVWSVALDCQIVGVYGKHAESKQTHCPLAVQFFGTNHCDGDGGPNSEHK